MSPLNKSATVTVVSVVETLTRELHSAVSVYGLVDPRTQSLRYIGKAGNPEKRYVQHVASWNLTAKTENDVRAIRALADSGATKAVLANDYGISRQTLWSILNRRTWKHV